MRQTDIESPCHCKDVYARDALSAQRTSKFPCHCEPERAWQSPGTIHLSAQQNEKPYREIATSPSTSLGVLAMTVEV